MDYSNGIRYVTAFHFKPSCVNWATFEVCRQVQPRKFTSISTTITWRNHAKHSFCTFHLVYCKYFNKIEIEKFLIMLVFRETLENDLLVKLKNAYGRDIVEEISANLFPECIV